jgi:hypothetical protein
MQLKLMQQKLMQPQSWRVIVALLFSILWTIIQYSSGNGWEGIYLVLFVLAMLFFRPVAPLLLAIFIAIVLLFLAPTADTLFQMKSVYLKAAKDPARTINEIVRPGSGQQVLPDPVLQMLELIKKHELQKYSLSKKLTQNNLFFQRIIESAWPVKLRSKSGYQFRLNSEKSANEKCKVLDRQKDISLDYCR